MSKHFVLVHGAWHGGWCWDGVIRHLTAAGHTAEAPTIPGNAPDDDRSNITFDLYVDKLVEVLSRQAKPVVLVGHSSGGFMVQSTAPKVAAKIERLIFVNGFILPDGMAQFDLVPPEVAQGMTAAAGASPDNTVPVDEGFVRNVLMAGDPPDVQDKLLARLVPQPLTLFTTKINAQPFNRLAIPKTVLFCTGDASLPPGAYLEMAKGLGDYNLIEIDGGHETLFTNPELMAQKLIQAAT
jgi:pimeloyl-ACP methyl ester carboxylesterase